MKDKIEKLESDLEKEANLVTEAILDIITIVRINNDKNAFELIKEQFVVIDRQDLKNE